MERASPPQCGWPYSKTPALTIDHGLPWP